MNNKNYLLKRGHSYVAKLQVWEMDEKLRLQSLRLADDMVCSLNANLYLHVLASMGLTAKLDERLKLQVLPHLDFGS